MSAPLHKSLRLKYSVRSLPVRQGDVVKITRGRHRGQVGAVLACYRKKYCIHIDKISREKANGTSVPVNIDASNVEITEIKMDNDRKSLLVRKMKQTNE
jgi:large subunit ribosomal protein L26e